MLNIRLANSNDFIKVRDFYYLLIDTMQAAEYKPGWKKDVYPTQIFITKSIEGKELFVGEIDGKIVSCMVVNHEYNEGYQNFPWSVKAEDSEIFVIHALGVLYEFAGRGIAKQMVNHAIIAAKDRKIKTIRLDVLDGNIPAEKAYTKIGFKYLDTIQMFYEDTGWTDCKLFEYIV